MKKIISFSLYGTKPIYLIGAICNARDAKLFYPEWVARFYVGKSVPLDVLSELMSLGAEVIYEPGPEDASAMFWRFRVFGDLEVERAIIRDADSRFTAREASAVAEWILSDKDFHIMRDHPAHNCEILGGLWGAKTEKLRHINEMIDAQVLIGRYGEDQDFLTRYFYPLAKQSSTIHDSYFSKESWAKPFPTKLIDYNFVGQVYDHLNKPRESDRLTLIEIENSCMYRYRLKIGSWIRRFQIK